MAIEACHLWEDFQVVGAAGLESRPVRQTVGRSVFFATLRQEIKESVNTEELLSSSSKCRVSMKDLSALVFEKDAIAG
jgi:hypothetical protein